MIFVSFAAFTKFAFLIHYFIVRQYLN